MLFRPPREGSGRRVPWPWLLLSLILYALPAQAQTTPHWQTLAKGLEFGFLEAEETARWGGGRLAILRIDPPAYRFRVLAAPPGEAGHTAGEWRESLGALAVINAGQHTPDKSYLGLIITDGIPRGRLVSRLKGLFVAGPVDPAQAGARVLDLRYTAFDPQAGSYRQAAQSLMLLDRFGNIRVRRSARVAHRTVIAEDRRGRILFMITEGGHTLWELADFLSGSGLGLREVMCMDGGPEAQLDIKVKDFSYRQYGGSSAAADLPLPWPAASLPVALGVFPAGPGASDGESRGEAKK